MQPTLEILHPDGTSERHALAADRVIVGRQPRDGIAVPGAGELELEHLLLTARQEGCWFSIAQDARTPALVGGHYFSGGLVPWGTAVSLGSLWFKVTNAAPEVAAARASSVSMPTVLAAVALIGAAGWLLMSPGGSDLPEMPSVKPPELFSAAAKSCPDTDPAAAGARARETAEAARAKSERYPFAAQDGIKAAELYSLAASCYTAAGREGDADRVYRDLESTGARIQEDYRTHRLKLERAIQYGQTREALIESRQLLALVSHLDHPYTTWLRSLERRLTLKTEPKK